MSRSAAAAQREKLAGFPVLTFSDLPPGTPVRVICLYQDGYFFRDDTGIVVRNLGRYLGVIVRFHAPRQFTNGYVQTEFNFNPTDLALLHDPVGAGYCGA